MKRLCILIVFFSTANVGLAQDWAGDLERLTTQQEPVEVSEAESTPASRKNPVTAVMNAALTVYQTLWSKQLSTRCVYSLSCSRFSREAIRQHGPIKGVILSADRINRCNEVHYQETSPLRRDAEGKIIDLPEAYHRH